MGTGHPLSAAGLRGEEPGILWWNTSRADAHALKQHRVAERRDLDGGKALGGHVMHGLIACKHEMT